MAQRLAILVNDPRIRVIATLTVALLVAACGPGGGGGNGGY